MDDKCLDKESTYGEYLSEIKAARGYYITLHPRTTAGNEFTNNV
jgi:hypothetical protein